MHLTKRIAITAGALTLTATGIAAAGSAPDEPDETITTSAVEADDLTDTDAETTKVEDDAEETEEQETEATDAEDAGQGPVDNHGAVVSAVAQTEFPTGREHGEAVSAAARDNHGAEARAANEHAELGPDNAGEHGKP